MNILEKYKITLLSILFLSVFVDILFVKTNSDITLFGLTAIYLLMIYIYKLKSKITFFMSLIILVIMYICFLSIGPKDATERAAVWLVFFLGIGIWQQWKE